MQWRRATWAWTGSLVLSLILVVHAPTYAQAPQQTALARTLFEEGVALADTGDWVGAADRFERAYSLKPTPGIAFNWATALVETGQLLHAHELLRSVERDGSADAELKRQSEQVRRSLEPRMARLRVRVLGSMGEDARLEVDGVEWPRAAWNVTSPIDPGSHAVVLYEHGDEQGRVEVTLAEGGTREVVLGDPARPAAPLALSAVSSPTPLPRSDRRDGWSRRKHIAVWTTLGVAVAGGVVAAVLLTRRRDDGASSTPSGPGILQW